MLASSSLKTKDGILKILPTGPILAEVPNSASGEKERANVNNLAVRITSSLAADHVPVPPELLKTLWAMPKLLQSSTVTSFSREALNVTPPFSSVRLIRFRKRCTCAGCPKSKSNLMVYDGK
jgi:hypothetical protein